MKFFADTADLQELAYCFANHVNDGITTNPKIMEVTGDLSKGIDQAYQDLLNGFPGIPLSLETDLRGVDLTDLAGQRKKIEQVLLEQGRSLADLDPNVVVKIPICDGGLDAVKILKAEGIKTNVTACMTPFQALEAAKAGATYVSLFANRMLDCVMLEMATGSLNALSDGSDWKAVVKANVDLTEKAWHQVLEDITYVASTCGQFGAELIVGSIRTPNDIHRLVKAEPHIITIPTGIVKGLEQINVLKATKRSIPVEQKRSTGAIHHPMTYMTILEFEKAAEKYRKA